MSIGARFASNNPFKVHNQGTPQAKKLSVNQARRLGEMEKTHA
jgi:hypothetical protein